MIRSRQVNQQVNVFHLEIFVRVLITICAFILSSGFVTNYSVYAMRITPSDERKLRFVASIEITMSCCCVVNIVAIFVNMRINYRYRNLRVKGPPDSPLILYLFCLPLFVITIIGIGLVVIIDTFRYHCQDRLFTVTDSVYCFLIAGNFLAVIVLLLDISGREDTGEEWRLNLVNLFTIVSTIATLWTQVVYNLLLKSTNRFGDILIEYFGKNYFGTNCTHDTTVESLIDNFKVFVQFKVEAMVIAMLIFTPYLITPMQRHLRLLLRNTSVQASPPRQRGPLVSVTGIIAACALIVAYFSTMTIFAHEQTVLSKIVHHVVVLLLYIVGSGMCLLMIHEIKYWRGRRFKRFFHFSNSMLFLGVFCEFSMKTISFLINTNGAYDLWRIYYVLECLIHIFFVGVQATLVSLIFERHPRRPDPKSWNLYFCPLAFLIVVGVTNYFEEYYFSLSEVHYHKFQFRVTLHGIISFARPFVIFYKTLIIANIIRLYVIMYKDVL